MEQKPWLNHYDPGVPHSFQPYPQQTLLEVISETTRQRPNHPALLFKGARLSYAQLEQLSDALAAALVAQGVKKGDRVALLLPNCPQAFIGQWGAWKAGAIVTPINPLYTPRELEHALQECGAETALVLTPFYDKIKALQSRIPLRILIAANIKEYLPPHLRLLFTLLKEKKEGHRITLQPGDLWLADLLRQYAHSPRPNVPVGPDDPAVLLFTGGTSGTPKAAIGTHRAVMTTGMQAHAWFSNVVADWDDVIMLAIPMFHVYGNVGIVGAALMGRNPLALVPNPRDLDDLTATLRKIRPAFLPGVPALFIALLNHPQVQSGKVDLKSVKLCISGAAPLLTEVKQRFETITGGRVIEAYSCTETMLGAVLTPVQGTYKPGSAGIPLPDIEVRIADPESGEGSLPTGQVGEILMRCPQLMSGYWQRPAETAEVLREGWLYTGDLGYLDEDGYLFVVDRKKDVIKPGGFQVWPREVEEVLMGHPAVSEVGVAGVPDAHTGEAVKAWIVLMPGQTASVEEIKAYCRENLAGYKVPKHIEFIDALPKTLVGKVLRRELAAREKTAQPQPETI